MSEQDRAFSDTEPSTDPILQTQSDPQLDSSLPYFEIRQDYEDTSPPMQSPSLLISENYGLFRSISDQYEYKIKQRHKISEQILDQISWKIGMIGTTKKEWPPIVQEAAITVRDYLHGELCIPDPKFDSTHNFKYRRSIIRMIVNHTYHKIFQEKYLKRRKVEDPKECLIVLSKFLKTEFKLSQQEVNEIIEESPESEYLFILNMFFSPYQMHKITLSTTVELILKKDKSLKKPPYMAYCQDHYQQKKNAFYSMLATNRAIQFYLRDIFYEVVTDIEMRFEDLYQDCILCEERRNKKQCKKLKRTEMCVHCQIYTTFKSFKDEMMDSKYKPSL